MLETEYPTKVQVRGFRADTVKAACRLQSVDQKKKTQQLDIQYILDIIQQLIRACDMNEEIHIAHIILIINLEGSANWKSMDFTQESNDYLQNNYIDLQIEQAYIYCY